MRAKAQAVSNAGREFSEKSVGCKIRWMAGMFRSSGRGQLPTVSLVHLKRAFHD
jgi:hypothetical protein